MSRGRKSQSVGYSFNWQEIFWQGLPTYISILNSYLVNSGSDLIKIDECLTKLSFKIPKGLNSIDINSNGNYPVISQSQEYIIGYSDNQNLLVNTDLPLIVFGDHSKTIKYVDHPFVIGADGIKLLKPHIKFKERFFYYFLHGVITDTKDYGRHFKLLREGFIPDLEDVELQNSIVAFLDDLKDNSIKKEKIYFNEVTENKILGLQNSQCISTSSSIEFFHQLNLVKKLRQQLSQDAVQGKLVEQKTQDEPANILLQKIKIEKKRLIEQKRLKKEKELPQIKIEDIPFEVPENWIWCRLGEIAKDITYGTSEKASDAGDIPVLRMGNITFDGRMTYDNLKYVSSTIKDLPNLYLADGDLLFNRTNSYELVGKTGVFKSLKQYTFASYLIRVRFMDKISSDYISTYVNSTICRKTQLEPQIIQQNGQANFNGTKLSNILIPLPPFAEQHRIVQKLDQLMQTCDALESNIKQIQKQNEQLLQQVIRELLTKETKQEEQLIEPAYVYLKSDDKYKALLLAAEIIWQLNQKQTLGHIKLQKLIYLCNRTQKMNLPVNFLKWAMGPYDPELQKYIDTALIVNQWFKYEEDSSLKYQPLKRAGDHKEGFNKYFAKNTAEINNLIQLFENAKSARIEIVATLFACWEDLIAKKQLVNDNSLLAEFYSWSEKKKKYPTEKVIDALRWMETHGIVPK